MSYVIEHVAPPAPEMLDEAGWTTRDEQDKPLDPDTDDAHPVLMVVAAVIKPDPDIVTADGMLYETLPETLPDPPISARTDIVFTHVAEASPDPSEVAPIGTVSTQVALDDPVPDMLEEAVFTRSADAAKDPDPDKEDEADTEYDNVAVIEDPPSLRVDAAGTAYVTEQDSPPDPGRVSGTTLILTEASHVADPDPETAALTHSRRPSTRVSPLLVTRMSPLLVRLMHPTIRPSCML